MGWRMSHSNLVPGGVLARYPSPLRYPGGKGKVANFLKVLVIENELFDFEYVEPYAGGASVALSLLFEDYVQTIRINDLNPGVYAFWRLATQSADKLCRWITDASLTIDEWNHQRCIYNDESADPDELGFATFYLNRTNRSGIISRGSVIGGVAQTGRWVIDARFNRSALIARIQKIARFAGRIIVSRCDAEALLGQLANDGVDRLYYLDPPYFVKGSRLYDNGYEAADHRRLRSILGETRQPWLISYDSAPEIVKMYQGFSGLSYTLPILSVRGGGRT